MVTVQVITRSQGQSAVAAAAYRTGSKLTDLRLGVTHNYTEKSHVAWSMTLAPESAPSWVWNREQLWNQVEAAEHRKDSQVAREFLVALPKELTLEQNVDLLMGFSAEQFVGRGMIADIGLHNPPGNPHAHILLTMRELQGDGFGTKNREWNLKPILYEMRQAWERHCNAALETSGSLQRVDCRSLEAQGIDRIPQIHLGSHAAKCLTEGKEHPKLERYFEIERLNAELATLQQEKVAVEIEIQAETQRQTWAETILPIASQYMDQQVQSGLATPAMAGGWATQWEDYRIVERQQASSRDWELEIYSRHSGNSIAKFTEHQGQAQSEPRPQIQAQDAQRFFDLHNQMQQQARLVAEEKRREQQREQERIQQEQQRQEELQRQQALWEQERMERDRQIQQQQEADRLAQFQQQAQWLDEIFPTAIESMRYNQHVPGQRRQISESQIEVYGSTYWAQWDKGTRQLDYYRRADGELLFRATREGAEDLWDVEQVNDLTQADLDFHRQAALRMAAEIKEQDQGYGVGD